MNQLNKNAPDIDRIRRITDKLRAVWGKHMEMTFIELFCHIGTGMTDTEFEEELDKMLGSN